MLPNLKDKILAESCKNIDNVLNNKQSNLIIGDDHEGYTLCLAKKERSKDPS